MRGATRFLRPGGDRPRDPVGPSEALRSEVGGLARGGLLNLGSSAASQLAMLVLTVVLCTIPVLTTTPASAAPATMRFRANLDIRKNKQGRECAGLL